MKKPSRTLWEAVEQGAKAQAPGLLKYLDIAGVKDWKDCSKVGLNEFKDTVIDHLCASSAKTYCAVLSSILHKWEDEAPIAKNYAEILRVKGEKVMKTYLNESELDLLEGVQTETPVEEYVKKCFLISARTGMRISDTLEIKPENVCEGYLTYVSKKTSVRATMPCGSRVAQWIVEVNENPVKVSAMGYNKALRRLCKRAGINELVRVFKAGESKTLHKWECVTSHTARASFCTILAEKGVPILDISRMAGHRSPETTVQNYICNYKIQLNESAMDFFNEK